MGFTGIAVAQCAQFVTRFLVSLTFMKFTKNKKISDHNKEPFFSKMTFRHLDYQVKICFH